MKSRALILTGFALVLFFSANFVLAFPPEWSDTACPWPGNQSICNAISDQNKQVCRDERTGVGRHYQCVFRQPVPPYGMWCQRTDEQILYCQDILTCNADNTAVIKQGRKCEVGTDPNTGGDIVICVNNGPQVTDTTCTPGDQKVCSADRTTLNHYKNACVQTTSTTVSCQNIYYPAPGVPAPEVCAERNPAQGTCPDNKAVNRISVCKTNNGQIGCFYETQSETQCFGEGRKECVDIDPNNGIAFDGFRVFEQQTCEINQLNPGTAAYCDPANPQAGNPQTCGTEGQCTGNNPFVAHTYIRECRTIGNSVSCVRNMQQPLVEFPGFPQNCRAKVQQCAPDGVTRQITPADTCNDKAPNPPPDDSTKSTCTHQNMVEKDCSSNTYYCENKPAGTPPSFIGWLQSGICDPNLNPPDCATQRVQVRTCSGLAQPVNPPVIQCNSPKTAIVQKMGNEECVLPDNDPSKEPVCTLVNDRFEIKEQCPTMGGETICTEIHVCGTGTSATPVCDPNCIARGGTVYECCTWVGSGNTVERLKICRGCREQGTEPFCDAWQELLPGLPCEPPQETVVNFCSPPSAQGVQCTLTTRVSGKCIDKNRNGDAQCEEPTVELVCAGPCNGWPDSDGDGIPDSEDTDDDNDGIPDDQDDDDDGDGTPDVEEPPPPEPPPCTKDCGDGSVVECSADCPPCKKFCADGSIVDCGIDCEQPPSPPPEPPPPPGPPPPPPPQPPQPPIGPQSFCTKAGKCVIGGGANPNDPAVECFNDSDCSLSCNQQRQCVKNGGGTMCSNDSDCELPYMQCNSSSQCVPGGGGAACSTFEDCLNLDFRCDEDNYQCVPGGPGENCTSWMDCQMSCNEERQCVLNGGGADCSVYTEDIDCAAETRCNDFQQCLPGAEGLLCDIEDENPCAAAGCDYEINQCIPGGAGIPCYSDLACFNSPPYVTNMRVNDTSYCTGIPGAGLVYFKWDYHDDDGDQQTRYWLEIDNNNNFSSPEVRREVEGSNNSQPVLVKTTAPRDHINFNTNYYWRVKVEDKNGIQSDWTYYNGTYSKSGHPAPSPLFSYSPQKAARGQTVFFTDASLCYNDSGVQYFCKTNPGNDIDYTWTFADGEAEQTIQKDPPNVDEEKIFSSLDGPYLANLEVCDTGGCCVAGTEIPVAATGLKELPNWKEISPFR